ncbi:hypothetical protein D3C76_1660930 [compost metagenome]
MGPGSMQQVVPGTITVIHLETIRLDGADHLRVHVDDRKLGAMSEWCLASDLADTTKPYDQDMALEILCRLHTGHGNRPGPREALVQ